MIHMTQCGTGLVFLFCLGLFSPSVAISGKFDDHLLLECEGRDSTLGFLEFRLDHKESARGRRSGEINWRFDPASVVLDALERGGFPDIDVIEVQASTRRTIAEIGPMEMIVAKKHLLEVKFESFVERKLRLVVDLEVSHWRYDDDQGPKVRVELEFRDGERPVWPRTKASFELSCGSWDVMGSP